MSSEPSPDLTKTARRLRWLRFPLAAMVAANTYWLVFAPSWMAQSGAAALAQATPPPPSADPAIQSAGDTGSQNATSVTEPTSTVELPAEPASMEIGEPSSPLAPADKDQGESTPPTSDGAGVIPGLGRDAASESPLGTPTPKPTRATLTNPHDSGGSIGFLADGQEHWLAPGETHAFPDEGPHEVHFHRGGEFGDARVMVEQGEYRFLPTRSGWRLEPTGDPQPKEGN